LDPKKAENQQPKLSSESTMNKKIIVSLLALLIHAKPINHNKMSLPEIIHGKKSPKAVIQL
jgi:hypothetical protein